MRRSSRSPAASSPARCALASAAHLLDEVEERPALLLDDRLAEQVAEPVDLLAEPVALACH